MHILYFAAQFLGINEFLQALMISDTGVFLQLFYLTNDKQDSISQTWPNIRRIRPKLR